METFSRKPLPTDPLVSVVIPSYNSARYVGQAVQSALAQTETRHEVIVVDDGSTDKTKEVLSKFGNQIKYFYQENRGPSAARNLGIKMAKGKYICFLDADDLWASNKLELQLPFMEQHREIGLSFAYGENFKDDGSGYKLFVAARKLRDNAGPGFSVPEAFAKLVMSGFIPTPTVMVRTECFTKVGLFDEGLRSVEDRDMWLRMSAYFEIARLSWVLCKRRLHNSNISSDQELAVDSRIRVFEKNRSLFPNLAPSRLWNNELGSLYLASGYNLLIKNRRKEARKAAFHSLEYYFTIKALGIVGLSLLSCPVIQLLCKLRRALLSKKTGNVSKTV